LGIVGFYLLCLYGETLTIETGDLLVLLCSVMFAVHILVVDYFVPKCDGVKMSCIQFLTAGLLGIICMFIFEEPVLKDILSNWIPIIYAGVLSCGMGYTFQIIGQKHAEPTQASLILCLESVFAAIAGAILLSERLSLIQYAGCIIIFAASIISNLPEKKA
ncbi:MAG: DMT family transporter, partial [Clostridia bacterium]|nr:DMT family transporter [Clostridia bacterium]